MKTIAFFEIENWEIEYIKKKLRGYKILLFKEPLTEELLPKIKTVDAIAVFIYSKIDKKILTKLPNLKLITTMSTGFDHIDLTECKKRKIIVTNVPYYGENTVAEHVFALLLSISRNIPESVSRTRKANFNLEGIRGFELKEKTIGLVGTGHISGNVARIAHGFEMNILGYDLNKNSDLTKKYGLKYAPLKTLLQNSDIISLHLPLNDATKHIINQKNLKDIKQGCIIINTARGGLIDTYALATAIQSGKIRAAGLDVLEEESFIKEEKALLSKEFSKEIDLKTILSSNIMLRMDNVLVTPHNAFNSDEALQRILDTTISNIQQFYKGKSQNMVAKK